MDPNQTQDPNVNPMPVADPNAGAQVPPVADPMMPTPPPVSPVEPVAPVTPEPVVPPMPTTEEPAAPAEPQPMAEQPAEMPQGGDVNGGQMPPMTPPAAV